MKQQDQTFVEINLSKILHNIKELKKLLCRGVRVMAVVKADAYGHGSVAVSKAIEKSVDYLAVATLSEALELKKAGIRMPILILSETQASSAREVIKNGFIQTVYTFKLAKALSDAARGFKRKAVVHFKVDTGMGRIGASLDEAVVLYDKILKLPNIKIEGIFTHFAQAEGSDFTKKQLDRFKSIISEIDPDNVTLHAANSAATLYHKDAHLDMVRVGLSMYGLYPPGEGKRNVKLEPAMKFKTHVVYLKRVPAGTPLSYGSTCVTGKETSIATLPAGYADGLPRALSNKGQVLINGRRYPIVGRVCMDLTLVDVNDDRIRIGDEVTLIGSQKGETISADEVAALADTISYEIICGIGKRVPRVYVK